MKRILILFMILLSVFFASWGVKAKTPINRPLNVDDGTETAWYENRYTAPQAGDEWYLDPEIPLNYIPVPGEDELYMVVDDSGNITGYRHRVQQADGSWLWEDVNPDIPDNYEKVEGLENIYKVTKEDGTVEYYKYVRNEDDTFCFVPVDEKGKPLDDGKSAETIDNNYVHVKDNVYAVYNDDNVKMGYRERVKNKNGAYVWKECAAPDIDKTVGNSSGFKSGNIAAVDYDDNNSKVLVGESSSKHKTENGDGTYTVTETTKNTVTEGGYTITYQTTVYKTYDKNGNLLSTKKDGPYEVSKVTAGNTGSTDKSKIAGSLSVEVQRLSAKVDYNTSKAQDVLAKLNAERKNQGKKTLKMNSDSEAYRLACIKAADMAINDYSSSNSPLYGTINDMVSRWNCETSHASENIWKTSTKSASEIHTRFQANEGSRKVRMSSGYSEVGIAVVEKNGQTYIAEVYLK